MCAVPGIHRVRVDRRSIDAAVVDQLEHVVAAGKAQHRLVQRRVGLADDRAHVRLLVDALPDELEPEQIAVERERALEVGDLVAGVMCTDDRHDGSLIGTRKLRWNSQTRVLSWLWPRVSIVTIPTPGREFETRLASTDDSP